MTSSTPEPPEQRLDALGLSAEAESLYAAILRGENPEHLDAGALAELVAVRLAREDEAGVSALPVRLAVESWAADRERELVQAREGAAWFAELAARHATTPGTFLQVLHGTAATQDAYTQITLGTQTELLVMERGPYATPPSEGTSPQQPIVSERGIQVRTLYHQSVTAHESVLAVVRTSQEMGEKARVFSEVPLRMLISDSKQALVLLPRVTDPADPERATVIDGVLVFASPLLDGLQRMFDLMWGLGVPIDLVGPGAEPTRDEFRQLLSMLSAGLTDASIARSLGVSERTVQRRIGKLQELLNANTRYLLGVQAARRGWI